MNSDSSMLLNFMWFVIFEMQGKQFWIIYFFKTDMAYVVDIHVPGKQNMNSANQVIMMMITHLCASATWPEK